MNDLILRCEDEEDDGELVYDVEARDDEDELKP